MSRPVAIVTGAGRGLGREHALALAQAGWSVLVNDLGGAIDGKGADASPAQDVAREIEALGGEALSDGSDVADWQAAGRMIERAVAEFGALNGLVNNAGVLRDRTLANLTEEDWDVAVRVNLKGTAAPLHHAARYWRDLAKAEGAPVRAAVVNTSSGSGLFFNPGQANYSAAKAGVVSLTMIAARELARYGVRANCIAPLAATRLMATVMSDGRMEQYNPALISPLVVYLLSEAAAEVTARVFNVGGDSLSAVDMARPARGLRARDGRWTAERIAQVMPDLLAGLPEPLDPRSAMEVMAGGPVV